MKPLKISIALLAILILFGCAKRVAPVEEVYCCCFPTPPRRPISVEPCRCHGYQVQVYAFLNQSYAERARYTLQTQFPGKVQVVYVPPYYKVRIGDFKSKREADRIKRKAVELGYWDAFVVPPCSFNGVGSIDPE